jgi:hypothetical protein
MLMLTGVVPLEFSGDLAALQLIGITGTVAVDAAFYAARG